MERLNEYVNNCLKNSYSSEEYEQIIKGFKCKKQTCFRVNLLKTTAINLEQELLLVGIKFERFNAISNAYILHSNLNDLMSTDCYKQGKVYVQNFSSMLPAILLGVKENEDVLDMCASPGGKTSLMCDIAQNKANIIACELNKQRFERLKFNMQNLGCKKVSFMQINALQLDDFFRFDKILLDAPCSGSGTVEFDNENSYKFLNEQLVKNSQNSQTKLLNKAISLLKKNCCLIYSTCSILKQENEDVVNSVLKTGKVAVEPINIDGLVGGELKTLSSTINGAITVMPTDLFEGFFVVKLKKIV